MICRWSEWKGTLEIRNCQGNGHGNGGCIGFFPLVVNFVLHTLGSVLDDWFDWCSDSPLLLGVSPFTLLVSWGQGLCSPSLSVLFSDTWCFWCHVSLFHEEEDSFLLESLVFSCPVPKYHFIPNACLNTGRRISKGQYIMLDTDFGLLIPKKKMFSLLWEVRLSLGWCECGLCMYVHREGELKIRTNSISRLIGVQIIESLALRELPTGKISSWVTFRRKVAAFAAVLSTAGHHPG